MEEGGRERREGSGGGREVESRGRVEGRRGHVLYCKLKMHETV